LIGTRCVFCRHRIREAHKRCVSCGNHYHNHCYTKAPVCSHPIIEYVLCIKTENKRNNQLILFDIYFHRHIKHLDPDRFNAGRTNGPVRNKEHSRSLPRIPLPVCNFI
jgi:hypothetical protein